MRLSEINKSCFDVINYYNNKYRYKNLYNIKYGNNDIKEKESLFRKLIMTIDSKLIDSLKKDYYKYYYIYLFCVLFKEQLVNIEDIDGIVKNVYNADYFSLLQTRMKLNDDIINMILKLVKDNNKVYLGKIPFDYRYHIIRRKEISENIKNQIVDSYSKEEIKEIDNELRDNILFEEIYHDEIGDRNKMFEDENLSDEYRVYQRINNKAS